MELNFKTSVVFEKHRKAKQRKDGTALVVHQGGARSTKTYSILQDMILDALEGKNYEFDIIRKSLPSLKGSAMRDFFDLLDLYDLYESKDHNKSIGIYHLNGSAFNFYSLDDQQKIRGRKRDIAFLNEANEMTKEDFRQISLRTTKGIYMDFNPSDEFHWIYDEVLTREDCTLIKSTFLDNPFLEERIQKEIWRLKDFDENDWTIFGLGERGKRRELIFTNWDMVESFPSGLEVIYGLDFGSTDPTALVKVGISDLDIWVQEILYKSELTNQDLIREMKMNEVSRSNMIYGDHAEPARIKEINQAGFKIKPCMKDVTDGIDWLKRYKIHIVSGSNNVEKDFKAYSWKKDRKGDLVDGVPGHNFSHSPDAVRYAVYTHKGKKKYRVYQFT